MEGTPIEQMSVLDIERQARQSDVRAALGEAPVSTVVLGFGLTVDVEDQYLLDNAIVCYLSGADAGAVFCAHASCERDLAAMVAHLDDRPAGSDRWALGRLIGHLRSEGLLPPGLLDGLWSLNEQRKNLYHYGHSDSERGLASRSAQLLEDLDTAGLRQEFAARHGYEGDNKDIWKFAIDRVLQRDALAAIKTTLRLRWWMVDHYGLGRLSRRRTAEHEGPAEGAPAAGR